MSILSVFHPMSQSFSSPLLLFLPLRPRSSHLAPLLSQRRNICSSHFHLGHLINHFPTFSAEHPQIALVRARRQRDFVLINHTAISFTHPSPSTHMHTSTNSDSTAVTALICVCIFLFFVFVLPLPHARGSTVPWR